VSDPQNCVFSEELLTIAVAPQSTGMIRLEDKWAPIPFAEQTNSSTSLIRSSRTAACGALFLLVVPLSDLSVIL
jgi:hypothetical protein